MRSRPRILVFPGSDRSGSLNGRLAGAIVKALALLECDVTRIALRDYPLPLYDGDLEAQKGQPDNAMKLARLFHEHDGMVVVSPEYNNSVSPLVKNTIDWVSRVRADARGPVSPYRGRVFGLAAASPGKFGGIRGLYHLRASIASCGALVVSEQLAVTFAERAFDEAEDLADEAMRRQLSRFVQTLVETAAMMSAR